MFLIRVAIDHGWGDVKTVHFRFRAGVLEILTEPAFFDNVIEYNGKYYKVGTKRSAVMDNKTSNDDYYILTLAVVFHIIYNFMLHIIYHRFRNCHSGFSTLFNPNYAY